MRPQQKQLAADWTRSLLWAAAIAIVIRTFLVGNFQIPSTSMVPTLRIGDRLLANRFLYALREPARGEVVIFRFPLDPRRDFVKRFISGPGERIRVSGGSIYINGTRVSDPGIAGRPYYSDPDAPYACGADFEVPPASYFMLGDNSINSQDSRYWGSVPRKNLVGKAVFIYWPPWRMGFVH